MLTRRTERLVSLVVKDLAAAALPLPLHGEREPSYVARCLSPVIAASVSRLEIPGLITRGEGLAPIPRVFFLGVEQRPDIAITSYADRLLAVEVKYLKRGQISALASTALGQALLYCRSGFLKTLVLFVDADGCCSDTNIELAKSLFIDAENYDIHFLKKGLKELQFFGRQAV